MLGYSSSEQNTNLKHKERAKNIEPADEGMHWRKIEQGKAARKAGHGEGRDCYSEQWSGKSFPIKDLKELREKAI